VLTPAESGALDRASEERGIITDSLMESAGRALADVASELAGGGYGRRAVVVCGKGNNGGDGMVAARHLDARGMRVTVVMLEDPTGLHEPASTNLERLGWTGVRVRPYSAALLARELARSQVAVDAIFGTGFRGQPEDDFAEAIDLVNAAGVAVVAADIPSGVSGETGGVEGEAVWADATVTFGAEKPGVVLLPGATHAGVVEVADIGFPPELVTSDLWVLEPSDVAAMLPARRPDTHKREAGTVLVVGGSRTMTGAVCLAARAAYRAGAGLVTVAVPRGILGVVESSVEEATFMALPETDRGTIATEALDALSERLESADAVALGPGMTTDAESAGFVREVAAKVANGLVIDADGLNAFAGRIRDLRPGETADVVLTPHLGEFARISGVPKEEIASDRVAAARGLSATAGATVLLKGSRTVIAEPGGLARINPTGGPFLATAGSGDVLTGTIAALLARGMVGFDAASAGAFLHGMAGATAALEFGEGTTAGDVAERLPDALREVRAP
jgi:NAD(P)H-hydrate epimerase